MELWPSAPPPLIGKGAELRAAYRRAFEKLSASRTRVDEDRPERPVGAASDSQTCACDGANPECYRCQGKGYTTSSDRKPDRLPAFRRRGSTGSPISGPVLVITQGQVRPSKPSRRRRPKLDRPKGRNKFRCHHCQARLKNADRLSAHLIRVHGESPPKKQKARGQPSQHVPKKPQDGGAQSSSGGSRRIAGPPRELDATFGGGGTFRDGGRFGSHPSHDGFDDESGS